MKYEPRCPHCESTDLDPCSDLLAASDRSEDIRANYRCRCCKLAFRFTPGIPGFTGTEVVV